MCQPPKLTSTFNTLEAIFKGDRSQSSKQAQDTMTDVKDDTNKLPSERPSTPPTGDTTPKRASPQAEVDDEADSESLTWGILESLHQDTPNFNLRGAGGPRKDDKTAEVRGGRSMGYVIGRHRECNIRLASSVVSNRHCVVYKENCWSDKLNRIEECVFIEDLSTNGTFINGKRLHRAKQHRLKNGDKIFLATELFFAFRLPERLRGRGEGGVHDKYEIGKTLGSGNFATVKQAVHRETGQKVAIKVITKSRIRAKPKFVENLRQEIAILMALNHPSIISILGVFDEEDYVYIVLELVKGGELFDAIIEAGKFSEETTRDMMRQLLEALVYIHSRGITHRDLKPENILLTEKYAGTRHFTIKISDFGLAKLAGEASFMGTLCGTPNYVAPEVLDRTRHRAYTKAVDLWSCGVVMYICLCGFPPFSEELAPPSMNDQIRQGKYAFLTPWWDSVSDEAKDMVTRLLNVNPDLRLSAEEALAHPWMVSGGSFVSSSTSTDSLLPTPDSPPPPAPAAAKFRRGDTVATPPPNKKRKVAVSVEDNMEKEGASTPKRGTTTGRRTDDEMETVTPRLSPAPEGTAEQETKQEEEPIATEKKLVGKRTEQLRKEQGETKTPERKAKTTRAKTPEMETIPADDGKRTPTRRKTRPRTPELESSPAAGVRSSPRVRKPRKLSD
ncbi:hypothetical protein HKX48_008373 [Thoreauomyces humboldtii]|nr:hypothetical protein HKX48_008373 [Thoreauomyces humboldtii]